MPDQLVLLDDSHLARLDRMKIAGLEAALHHRVVVHNHAFGGATSDDLRARAGFEGAVPGARLLVSIGTNDLAPWKQVPLARFASNVALCLERWGGTRATVLGPPIVDEERQARLRGGFGRTNALVAAYSDAMRAAVAAAGAQWTDPAAALGSAGPVHEDDGVHLNEHGYEVVLQQVARVIAGKEQGLSGSGPRAR